MHDVATIMPYRNYRGCSSLVRLIIQEQATTIFVLLELEIESTVSLQVDDNSVLFLHSWQAGNRFSTLVATAQIHCHV
jgi:hypothetical protein